MSATVLELEAKRLEVMKRRHQLQLSQMVSYEMERKQMQARHGMTSKAAILLQDSTCALEVYVSAAAASILHHDASLLATRMCVSHSGYYALRS